jgi:hypothetical protein
MVEKYIQTNLLEQKVHKKSSTTYQVVKRFLPSLEELGLPKYLEYTEEDKAIMSPTPLKKSQNECHQNVFKY